MGEESREYLSQYSEEPNFSYPAETPALVEQSNEMELSAILERHGYVSVLDLQKGVEPDDYLSMLEKAIEKNGNYFDLLYIQELRRPPLSDWSVFMQRALLRFEQAHLVREQLLEPDEAIDALPDERIRVIFSAYREIAYDYYVWQEQGDLAGLFSRRAQTAEQYYNVVPNHDVFNDNELPVWQKEKFNRNFVVTYASPTYGAVYDQKGALNGLFNLDINSERKIVDENEFSGAVSIARLEHLLSLLEAKNSTSDDNPLVNYIQYRNVLPRSIVEQFETQFSINIPQELDRSFDNIDEFNKAVLPWVESLERQFVAVKKEARAMLLDKLTKLREQKKELLRESNGGHTLERGSLSVLTECVARSERIIRQGDDIHHSICRYLYARQNLPPSLVAKFEKKFQIVIPPGLQNFKSFDDYLLTPNEVLVDFVNQYSDRLSQMEEYLLEKLEDLMVKTQKRRVQTETVSLEKVVEEYFVNKKTPEEARDVARSYGEMLSLPMRQAFEKKFGIKLEELTVREQLWLLNYLRHQGIEAMEKVIDCSRRYGIGFLRSFLSIEHDTQAGGKVVELFNDKLTEEDGRQLLEAYGKLVALAEEMAMIVGDEKESDAIVDGYLVRAKDLLAQAYKQMMAGGDASEVVAEILVALQRETREQMAVSGRFRAMAEIMTTRKNIDLSAVAKDQENILLAMKNNEGMALFLRALHGRGELAPIPEIHWRVDRSLDEYARRTGLDVRRLLESLKGVPEDKKVLVEFGPGSGASREERTKLGFDDGYVDVTMADKLYYPVDGLIDKSLAWDNIEKDVGKISAEEKKIFTEMLYKIFMITDGELANDKISYNGERVEALRKTPEAFGAFIKKLGARIEAATVVPSTISARDAAGNVIYPFKVGLTAETGRSKKFENLKKLFAQNPKQYLLPLADVFAAVPAFPAGVMIGDFSSIERLKDGQIDVSLAVRSTVYKKDGDYEAFLETLYDKLAPGGIAIDDSVRDNDGWRSRLAELTNVAKALAMRESDAEIYIVEGNGLPGEDEAKGRVPLAMVMGKSANLDIILHSAVLPGSRLVSLAEYLIQLKKAKPKRWEELDSTGQLKMVLEAASP